MDEVHNNQTTSILVRAKSKLRSAKKYLRRSFLLPGVIVGIFILIVAIFTVGAVNSSPTSIVSGENQKVQLAKPKATKTINKELQFPLKDASGKEVSKIRFLIDSAEIRDELIVKGKKARAVSGRTFLVLKLKIINDYKQKIQVNARDYIRLTVNNGKDKFAADIHSDPVEIQADSTKQSRLAFPINEDDKNLTLYIGELSAKKEEFKLNLTY